MNENEIKTESEYLRGLERLDVLWDAVESNPASEGSKEEEQFIKLAARLSDYEKSGRAMLFSYR